MNRRQRSISFRIGGGREKQSRENKTPGRKQLQKAVLPSDKIGKQISRNEDEGK